ncbi:MAG: hypothetical protein JRI44_11565, partial [Deltaproteobacteria bacterium]|nr:hypothetical protein [Deltaproteobacteria bacterium]
MKIFTKTDELFNEIINDKETRIISATRYPVRFIFIPNFNFFKEVIKRFDNLGINKIELAEFLPHNDGWFTVDDIKTIFDNLRDETAHLIIPLSEIARF